MENSVKYQIHQTLRITSNNGKTEYLGSTYAKNEVVIEPGWISNAFELREPWLYKLVTTVTHDDDIQNMYTVPVWQCNELTSVDESKYEEKRQNSLICPSEYISKKNWARYHKKRLCAYTLFLVHPSLFYQQGNHNSCILSSLASAFHYMGDKYASEYIIRRKPKFLLDIHNKVRMHFCRDILMRHQKEEKKKNSIIVLRNGIHPRHMIYFGISILIQLCVCY